MKRNILVGFVIGLAWVLASCGSSSPRSYCPKLAVGHGAIGSCAPRSVTRSLGHARNPGGIIIPDYSNNDPCYCGAALASRGHPGEIDKAIEGTGFSDGTFVGMVRDAAAHRLAVGGYDFDRTYTAFEAYVFINRLHAAGIWPWSRNTFPPTLDIETENPTRAGVEHQVAVLLREYGRVQIYTGVWFWAPHFGCWVPAHVTFWESGYPEAQLLCGLPNYNFAWHQFTDRAELVPGHPGDASVWRGSGAGYQSYAHNVTAPAKVSTAARRRQLESYIRALRHDLTVRRCRVIHGKSAYPACRTWAAHGKKAHRELRAI